MFKLTGLPFPKLNCSQGLIIKSNGYYNFSNFKGWGPKSALDPKIIIWKAQGVPQLHNATHHKYPEEEETSPNRNHIITKR